MVKKNEKQEIKYVKKILKKLNIEPIIINIDIDKYIDHDWKRWKIGIIPARNYLFAAFAGSIISKSTAPNLNIWICAHKEEIDPIHTDKSARFFKSSSKILSSAYNKNITVSTPFANITKPEIISYWNKAWTKKYGLSVYETMSCYFGINCGECKACFNRAVVFTCIGIDLDEFKTNPFEDKNGNIQKSYINKFKTLNNIRQLDFLFALNEKKSLLPPELKKFLDKNYQKYDKLIENRIKTIRTTNKI